MPRESFIAIGAGIISALAATAFISHVPGAMMLVYLADLPLFLAGFAFGPQSAAISGAVGFMAAGLIGGGLAAGVFGLLQALPAWLIVRQMLLQRPASSSDNDVKWFPAGDMLCWLTMLAAAFLLFATAASLSGEHGSLSALISDNLDRILKGIAPDWDPSHRARMVDVMAPMFPGAIGISWLVMTLLNAIIAQNVLTKMKKALRPTPAYADLELPQWISWPLVAAAALALLGPGEMEYTGRNLAMILSLPLFFLGLAVVHTWARRLSGGGLVLVAFYLILLLSGWATLLVAGLGLIELWSGLRYRMAGPSDIT
ncbi:MAG: DUF2232 domain-containing protein [Rhodospirillales bacterium]|nr:DUF2232 domain-containing protein [Alphaproteobacteria bacterium]MBL6947533.1 DUF2232 domain-containing protein [Rhodospirillales bacterium]